MEEKKPFAARMESFFAGKGFYIVLFLCIAVIGVSAWSMLAGAGEKNLDVLEASVAVADMESSVIPAVADTESRAELPAMEIPGTPATVTDSTPVSIPEAGQASLPETAPAVKIPEAPVPVVDELDYFIWPVTGNIENAYSMAALTFNRTMRDWRTHDGIDIAAELGTQVKAAANGRVAEIRKDDMYGTVIVLSHRDGLVSVYANLAETPTVSVGDNVGVGQVLGAVGDTALCEAGEVCHLHFAMALDGESVDPSDYLPS